MTYRIIGDSCTDLTSEMKKDSHFCIIPLSIQIEEEIIIDDETFNQKEFLRKVADSEECPKSSCPSPRDYMEYYKGDEDIYVITLSSKLSGSYNSAVLARKLYLEENPSKNILVIDSCSASIGQTLIAKKIQELVKAENKFEEITEKILKFRDILNTKFVLESLETLRKNGRLSNLKAIICNTLNIKPIMGATPEGSIIKLDQSRGVEKALITMAKSIEKDVTEPEKKTLGIAHCNNYNRALFTKEEILKKVPFKETIIAETAGISSMYANDGGIVVSY